MWCISVCVSNYGGLLSRAMRRKAVILDFTDIDLAYPLK